MWRQKLMNLTRPAPATIAIGLEWRTERLALVSLERTNAGAPPVLHAHACLSLPTDSPEAAALRLRETWQRLGLSETRVAVSVPIPPATVRIETSPAAATPAMGRVEAEMLLTDNHEQPARRLVASLPAPYLTGLLDTLTRAGLEPVQLQIDCLAMLTACSYTPSWLQAECQSCALIMINGQTIQWWHQEPATPFSHAVQQAGNPDELHEQLARELPDMFYLAGPAAQTQPLLASLQSRWPKQRYCSNPFAGIRLVNEQDRRPLAANASTLFVAYGLALGAA
ncbi:hypothetical protein THUN1379_26500 [Paludibacterium sp. THUN1379]|uniref:hypothetical protein n=1 Tax=Paludibacterium sp. THUN1379 TaxID=3112107 RepID=UPI003090AF67|nr:hypothetical protein THUN1379_26500 [Paludibacterium sp. THUN1379]